MRLLRVLRAILWSFFGVRRRADVARDLEGVPAAAILVTAVVAGMLFVAAIAFVVHLIAGGPRAPLGAPETAPSGGGLLRLHGPVRVADTLEERVRPCTGWIGAPDA